MAPASAWSRVHAAKSQDAEPRYRDLPAHAPSFCPRWRRLWDLPALRPVRRLRPRHEDSTPLRWPKVLPPQDREPYWNSPSDASQNFFARRSKPPADTDERSLTEPLTNSYFTTGTTGFKLSNCKDLETSLMQPRVIS